MIITGKNYVISIPARKKKPAVDALGPDDPRWKTVEPIKGPRRQIMPRPTLYMGKPLTPELRKKVEAEQAKREAARKREEKRGKRPKKG